MSWIFPVFFGGLALCAVIYGVIALRERLKQQETVVCALETRMREKFPVQTLVGRRDKVDYIQIYRTKQGEEIRLQVTKSVYKSIPKQVEGTLVHRGGRLISFSYDGQVITPSTPARRVTGQ